MVYLIKNENLTNNFPQFLGVYLGKTFKTKKHPCFTYLRVTEVALVGFHLKDYLIIMNEKTIHLLNTSA